MVIIDKVAKKILIILINNLFKKTFFFNITQNLKDIYYLK